MGTTRIKVIDLSSQEGQIKTARKHAEKLALSAKIKTSEKTPTPVQSLPEDAKTKEELTTAEQISETAQDTQTAKISVAKKQSTHHKGKKYQEAKKLVENKLYSAKEAIELLPKTSITKFDPAVEIHLNVTDKNTKGTVSYPHPFGTKQKQTKYLIFSDVKLTTGDKDKQIIHASQKTIDEIESGKLKPKVDFDAVLTTPKFMPQLAKVAKILGPAGLMPNPKDGTIAEDIQKALKAKNKQGYQYKTDPAAPIVHAKIGKLSQKSSELEENLKTLVASIGASRIRKGVLATTMGPAVKLDISTI